MGRHYTSMMKEGYEGLKDYYGSFGEGPNYANILDIVVSFDET